MLIAVDISTRFDPVGFLAGASEERDLGRVQRTDPTASLVRAT
jgi:hypothetical protein